MQEGAELALDEASDWALAFLRAGEEGLGLLLDHAVEDALLGATARVASLLDAAQRGTRMGARGSALVHTGRSLPAPLRPSAASSMLGRAWPRGSGTTRSHSDRGRLFTERGS